MIVKVCGIRNLQNLSYLAKSDVDWVGFIFFNKSKRNFPEGDLDEDQLSVFNKKKVGVFVNESIETISSIAHKYGLNIIQLHGDESPEFCEELRNLGLKVMKAFSVYDELPVDLKHYELSIDYALFDTKGVERGGNGVQFDWSVLEDYDLDLPFLVSGGIGVTDVTRLKEIKNNKMAGVDINSRFELEPGLKDEQLLEQFIQEIKT
ncbi:phosphoribosylanthranilate isomerase [Reichenbachiella versicolor]|uniref:phosphoribosylanthranilate isomerase n=1 Tax=Reichenbachiella versicolor TaxID=1821036 RepID=UPI000D6E9DE0|nr:phosphoribosylanthranilate isomerase [Reichenbachiella versicolor]